MLLAVILSLAGAAQAETGAQGWLRYAPILHPERFRQLPRTIVIPGNDAAATSAAEELRRGLSAMLADTFTITSAPDEPATTTRAGSAIIFAPTTHDALTPAPDQATPDSFEIQRREGDRGIQLILTGDTARAELYAAFRLLEEVGAEASIPTDDKQTPAVAIRWVNQWDNFDGSVERGYAGRSIFFDGGHVRQDLSRASAYARLLASVGLNGCTVNNVNSDPRTLDSSMLRELARIAEAFRPWGVRLSLSVDLSSPATVGGLKTFDPLDPVVIAWWQKKVAEIYTLIPDFGGFVVKADSEGRPGPSQYGRTPADAANVLARALASHHGVVLYRGFVYNQHLDYNDQKADRARAGYDNFHALDGAFEPNVIIQIKHGPLDFQVREPVSPLFAGLRKTNEAIELQTSQEYTGQQRDMVFLVPMWKTALDTDLHIDNRQTPLKAVVEGKVFDRPIGGFVSVVNVGLDENWLHHPMAMANLYGFGRLAWNPDATAEQITDTWTRLTFGNDPAVVSTISQLQLGSWHAYEQITGPLGLGTLTNLLGFHFGPGPETADHNGWGQWIRADAHGVGMDRTVATGTGYIGQYPPQLAAIYESLKTCPDDLLLFMHHVPYSYVLHNGKTVIQYLYDAHYAGAQATAGYVPAWESLRTLVDKQRFEQTLALFRFEEGQAIVWRDAITEYFARLSGTPDRYGRVGNFPNRIEAESMKSTGYQAVAIPLPEMASQGKVVVCHHPAGCTLQTTFGRPAGDYKLAVGYFDLHGGISHYELQRNDVTVARWQADDTLPPAADDPELDGQTATRFFGPVLALKPGDVLTLRGIPDGKEPAPVDYLELAPAVRH